MRVLPRLEVPVVDDARRRDGEDVPVAGRTEGESGVVAESSLARRVALDGSKLSVAFGAAVLQCWQAEIRISVRFLINLTMIQS
jgi:hypothetical protein